MNPLDQLSLVWQVWGAMLLGAILMMLAIVIGVEWAWICWSARTIACAAVAWWRRTFTDPPTRPHTVGTFGHPPSCCLQFVSPHPHEAIRPTTLTTVDADEILITARGGAFRYTGPGPTRPATVIRFHAAPWDPDTPPFPFTPLAPHDDDTERRRQLLALAATLPGRPVVH